METRRILATRYATQIAMLPADDITRVTTHSADLRLRQSVDATENTPSDGGEPAEGLEPAYERVTAAAIHHAVHANRFGMARGSADSATRRAPLYASRSARG